MNWTHLYNIIKTYHLVLVPILALAFYMSFIPHLNYPYPLHLDEWLHLSYSNQMIREDKCHCSE